MDVVEPRVVDADGLALVVPGVLGVVGLGITGWGFYWLFGPAFRGPEAARAALGTHRLAIGSWLALFVLSAIVTVPLAPMLRLESGLTTGSFVVATLAVQVPLLLIVYVRLIMPGAVTWQDLGLKPLPVDYLLRMGLGVGLVGLAASFVLSTFLDRIGLRSNQAELYSFVLREGPLSFAVLLFFAAIVAPFVEELFFRGFLFGTYKRRQPLWVAYLGSSILFTLLHVQPGLMNPSQAAGLSVGIGMLALLLAWVYDRTGSLYPGVLAHAVNNGTGLILFYFVDQAR